MLQVKPRVGVAFADLVLISQRMLHGELPDPFLNARAIFLVIAVPTGLEHLHIVKDRSGTIHLKGKVGALLFDDRMFGVHAMAVVDVRHHFVADKLHRHRVPTPRLKGVRAFAVPHGEPRPAAVHRGLHIKMIAPNMQHGVVVPGGARHEPDVLRSIKPKIKPHQRIFEVWILVKNALVLAGDFIAPQHAILHFPFLVEKPAATHLTRGKVIAKMQIPRRSQQRPRGDARAHLLSPVRQSRLQFAHAFRFLARQVQFLRRILGEVEERKFLQSRGIEILNQFPVPRTDGPTGNAAEKVRFIQRIMPV